MPPARRHTLLVAAAVALGGCGRPPAAPEPPPDGPPWFEDATDAAGIDFTHDAGLPNVRFVPQIMGSGCAFLDADGDGKLDLYLLQFGGPGSKSVNRFYQQVGGGRFEDATAASGLGLAGHCHGVAVGDVNNDGRPDILVTRFGGLTLFVNTGGGRFEDATAGSGLINPGWGTSAAFLDFDRDGWLDLVVVNYLDHDPGAECLGPDGQPDYCGPSRLAPVTSRVFRNLRVGDARPRFADVSVACGIGRAPGPGLGVACADFTGDGWVDVLVANDGAPNRLWVNQTDGTFKDDAGPRGVAYSAAGKAYAGMGIALGDTTGGGRLDVYVTHMNTQTHTLWRQEGPGRFRDCTIETGLGASAWRGTGFGAALADFDNDGAVDVAVASGRVFHNSPAAGPGPFGRYADRNQLFANDGSGKFRDVSAANPAVCGGWAVGRGLAAGDYDGDGGTDLLVTAVGGRARLYRNVAPNRGHWLAVRVVDPAVNRDAYGAEVRVAAGGKERLRVVSPNESYLSSHAPAVLLGLGAADRVDAVRVLWPDGTREEFPGGPADRAVVVRKGEGRRP